MKSLLSLFFFCLVVSSALAHSWVQCTDYTQADASSWNAANCKAYPRAYTTVFQYANYQFGADAGMDYKPSETKACKTSPSSNDYTTQYPSATYSSGQRVCLAWPAKNHVAASCTNQYIPDSGVKIYRSGPNPTSDPTLSAFQKNLVADLGAAKNGDLKGFQHCPNFCAGTDKAFCEGCFNLPTNITAGKYTFMWLWGFNSPTDLYSTCWEVTIR